jgi:hypothetical protein
VKRAAIAVSMLVGLAPSAAHAYDWSIVASESETVELNSNQFLRQNQAGTLGSYTTLTANAQARTPTTRFDLYGDGSYTKYWGPGVEGLPSEFLSYGFRARYEIKEKNNFDREFVESSWRQQSTSLAILNNLGVAVKASGFLDQLRAMGGLDRSLTALDTISLFATSTRTSYEPSGGGLPFNDTLARGSWRRSVNPIASILASSEYELLDYENAFNTRLQIYREQLGIDINPTTLISFRANAGVAYLTTERGVSTSPFAGTNSPRPVNSAIADWIGDAAFTYRMLKDTTLFITAIQSVGPSVVGSLIKSDSVNATLTQNINSRSTLSLSAGWSRQISAVSTDFVTASATYNYNLTREWLTQFTYRYQQRLASTGGTSIIDPLTNIPTVSGTGPTYSHSLMVIVTHNWTVLPSGSY